MEYYSTIKKSNDVLIHATTWMNVEDMLSERSHTKDNILYDSIYKKCPGTSLVAQWLRIRLPMQGTWVPSLVQEDPT